MKKVILVSVLCALVWASNAIACASHRQIHFGYNGNTYAVDTNTTIVEIGDDARITFDDKGGATLIMADGTVKQGHVYACFKCISSPTYINWDGEGDDESSMAYDACTTNS